MKKIMLLNNISQAGVRLLEGKFEVTENIDEASVVMVRSAKMHDTKTDHLLAIARAGAGTNNVPVSRCADEGVVVFNTPGANANAVKELLLLGMLMSARDVLGGNAWVKTLEGNGDEVPSQVEKGKKAFNGTELLGKRVAVVGMGAIGSSLANTLSALGMEIQGYSPSFARGMRPKTLKVDVKCKNTVEDVVRDADYVVLSLPLKDDTRGMFNKSLFSRMKDGAILLNFSRAELMNEDDLEEALQSGKIRKYVTDFATDRQLGMKNTICLPHMGASTDEATENCAVMGAKDLIDYIYNGNIKHSVNYPEISLGEKFDPRMVILYKGTDNEKAQIDEILSALSIKNQNHATRGEYNAIIVDADDLSSDIVDKLSSLEFITKARIV
jgi:D-3-phosphoglycerate dehydrogenase